MPCKICCSAEHKTKNCKARINREVVEAEDMTKIVVKIDLEDKRGKVRVKKDSTLGSLKSNFLHSEELTDDELEGNNNFYFEGEMGIINGSSFVIMMSSIVFERDEVNIPFGYGSKFVLFKKEGYKKSKIYKLINKSFNEIALETTKEDKVGICCVCMERRSNIVFWTCKHCCMCEECSNNQINCPICRMDGDKIKIIIV